MAYRAKIEDPDLRAILLENVNHFWAVSNSVGWGCTNKYEDVLLVQYLINSSGISKWLEPDGIFGNETNKGIKYFQKLINKRFGETCQADGRVSRMDGSRAVTHSSGHYTIHLLNWAYLQTKRVYYGDVTMDAELPSALCWALMK